MIDGWGLRRGEPAIIYRMPNHSNPLKPHKKGVTETELRIAFSELQNTGRLSRKWFNENLKECRREGACNFTTIGGLFVLLGYAAQSGAGVYEFRSRENKA